LDSHSSRNERQSNQQNIEETAQKSPEKLKVLINGEEKEATVTLRVGNLGWTTGKKTLEEAFIEFGEL
jgi:hypothetical protein